MSEKKIAVVTGGARGIGKAIALELAKAGNLVVINYNGSEEKARETKAEIETAGGQADILQCNVADFDACEAFFKAVDECKGRVELVTGEGDRLNLKSKLSQYVSLANIFSAGEIPELEIVAAEKEDIDKLMNFMING